jgi:hypothetical protein
MAAADTKAESVEALERVLSYLVIERQRLRSTGAGRPELEANRLAIVSIQSHLGRALAVANGPPAA